MAILNYFLLQFFALQRGCKMHQTNEETIAKKNTTAETYVSYQSNPSHSILLLPSTAQEV